MVVVAFLLLALVLSPLSLAFPNSITAGNQVDRVGANMFGRNHPSYLTASPRQNSRNIVANSATPPESRNPGICSNSRYPGMASMDDCVDAQELMDPKFLDTLDLSSTANLYEIVAEFLQLCPDVDEESVLKFVERSAKYGKPRLVRLVLDSQILGDLNGKLTEAFLGAASSKHFVVAAILRDYDSQLDEIAFEYLCNQRQTAFYLSSMIKFGVVNFAQVYRCIRQSRPDTFQAVYLEDQLGKYIRGQIRFPETIDESELSIFKDYILFSGEHLDPLMYAASEGDLPLLDYLLSKTHHRWLKGWLTDNQRPLRDVLEKENSKKNRLEVAQLSQRFGAIIGESIAPLVEAKKRGHNDILYSLVRSGEFTPQQLSEVLDDDLNQ